MLGKRKTKSLSTLTPRSFRRRVLNDVKDDLAHYSTVIAVIPNDNDNIENEIESIQSQSIEFNSIRSNESCSDELFSDNSGIYFESDDTRVNIHGNEPDNPYYSEDNSKTPL